MLSTLTAPIELPTELTQRLLRPTWVEVDLDAIECNVRTVKRWVGNVRVIGVLKGDGCGFGAAESGLAMQQGGVDMVAVGNAFEVPLLRARGVDCPILLYASYAPGSIGELTKLGAILTIVDEAGLESASVAARRLSKRLDVFVKIDTGLGRLGVPYKDAVELIQATASSPSLRLLGLYSHCGSADAVRTSGQLERMRRLIARTNELGITVPFNVLAATPQLRQRPDMWLTAVDPGRLLFGIQPDGEAVVRGELFSALRALRSRLIQVKSSSETDPPDYDRARTGGVRRYGILPFGWTDVLLREPYERSGVLVRGAHVPFATAMSAEHSVIDLTSVPDAQTGDIVTILGQDGEQLIDLAEVAKQAGVPVSDITRRLHRHLAFVYFRNGQPVRLKTPLEEVDLTEEDL